MSMHKGEMKESRNHKEGNERHDSMMKKTKKKKTNKKQGKKNGLQREEKR